MMALDDTATEASNTMAIPAMGEEKRELINVDIVNPSDGLNENRQ